MIYLFGRVLGKKNRLYLAYEEDWLIWAKKPADTFPTFPTFEEWLTTRTEQAAKGRNTVKGDGDVRS